MEYHPQFCQQKQSPFFFFFGIATKKKKNQKEKKLVCVSSVQNQNQKPYKFVCQLLGLCLAFVLPVCYHGGMKIYFGGSRHFSPTEQSVSFMREIVLSNTSVHVGCQRGADQTIVSYVGFFAPSSLFVFAVAPNQASAPLWVKQAPQKQVKYSAGGTSTPMPARFLLRSIAAFQGCDAAVFFDPGKGSLAVAREFAKTHKPIFAFSEQTPAPIPNTQGAWCITWFHGFQCWGWGYLSQKAQPQLF